VIDGKPICDHFCFQKANRRIRQINQDLARREIAARMITAGFIRRQKNRPLAKTGPCAECMGFSVL
jgi:hypothetical protein